MPSCGCSKRRGSRDRPHLSRRPPPRRHRCRREGTGLRSGFCPMGCGAAKGRANMSWRRCESCRYESNSRSVCPRCDRQMPLVLDELDSPATPPDVHARTTVGASQELSTWNAADRIARGASFYLPTPQNERLVARIASYLTGKVVMRDDHATQSAAANDFSRNLAQILICDFDITERCHGAEPVSAADGDTEDLELYHNAKGP